METTKKVMACVTTQKGCRFVIEAAARIAEKRGDELTVVHVARHGYNFLGQEQEGAALEYLFEAAKANGADLNVIRADDVVHTLTRLAKKLNVDCMVLGMARDQQRSDIIKVLRMRLPDVIFEIVQHD